MIGLFCLLSLKLDKHSHCHRRRGPVDSSNWDVRRVRTVRLRDSIAIHSKSGFVLLLFAVCFAPSNTLSRWFQTRIDVPHYLDMVGVTGSIPVAPTVNSLFLPL